jgi:hypothetical protein
MSSGYLEGEKVSYASRMKRTAYSLYRERIGGSKNWDSRRIVAKEMEFDHVHVERLWLTCGFSVDWRYFLVLEGHRSRRARNG